MNTSGVGIEIHSLSYLILLGTLKIASLFDPKLIVFRSVPLKMRFRPFVASSFQPDPFVIFLPGRSLFDFLIAIEAPNVRSFGFN